MKNKSAVKMMMCAALVASAPAWGGLVVTNAYRADGPNDTTIAGVSSSVTAAVKAYRNGDDLVNDCLAMLYEYAEAYGFKERGASPQLTYGQMASGTPDGFDTTNAQKKRIINFAYFTDNFKGLTSNQIQYRLASACVPWSAKWKPLK